MFEPNSLVMYKGGGYDGCIWESNYAFIDADGEFHNIAATGCYGCDTFAKLKKAYENRPKDFDSYPLPADVERFAREAPLSHLLGVARWLEENANIVLEAPCGECGCKVDITQMQGVEPHGIGGIMSEYSRLLCESCYCEQEDEEQEQYCEKED